MQFARSDRFSAFLLLGAAALALVVANSPIGDAVLAANDAHLAIPWLGLDLSVGHWISDGLLAIFFLLVAIELKHELTRGELASPSHAIAPAVAALGGVVVPALIYVALTAGSGYQEGWPIPTATDIAFALGVLAVFGRGLPGRVRAFLLALAVLDDLVAILIIAVFFTTDPQFGLLLAGAAAVVGFGLLSRVRRGPLTPLIIAAMIVLAVTAWYFVLQSGVHATIAGVALGLAMKRDPAGRLRHAVEPYSNAIILPLFAFSAALVPLPQVSVSELAPPFWGILVALPVGKLVGITLAGAIVTAVVRRRSRTGLSTLELLTVAALGGIGFTVSLLMNELAFENSAEVADEGTLAVLLGSSISIVLSAVLVTLLARRHRRGRVTQPPTG
ncbi:Na+/H+ antiporter NhaA [Herbiconiux sp. L3-i23]|uniref:Na+/H+ antiporter NhaA n=1 Tax=Herbiconiux sp. L3-i23 TaxID=2905871 RepID=UPI00206301FC|nr:Na+/H+ antiporter NhaA [Herbiconiux sp. L3-i23]BDI23603.1 Na(+)/H(+) antiporter NhaA [Herbiconiux sp. L3-i23]